MLNDIITEHKERMLNLKKYYPFFKLMDVSFAQFQEGRYEMLDMRSEEHTSDSSHSRKSRMPSSA